VPTRSRVQKSYDLQRSDYSAVVGRQKLLQRQLAEHADDGFAGASMVRCEDCIAVDGRRRVPLGASWSSKVLRADSKAGWIRLGYG